MKRYLRCFWILLLLISISSCAKQRPTKLPPVVEGWHKLRTAKKSYVVQKNDTLYSIAWAFNVDYRYLATINNIKSPYNLYHGQRLYIALPAKAQGKNTTSNNIDTNTPLEFKTNISQAQPLLGWVWPALGRIAATFNKKVGGTKGLDIVGTYGQPILACSNGTVVYSGSGIRSYGKLIIIKHSDDYLSAYAYNKNMLVEEGQEIKTGQKIATMGKNNEGKPMLHFEIRRFGKPIDPLLYLPKKS